ncbi:MAG: FAD-dependent oxidoreductase [Armatimonadota bacterium]
MKDASHDAVQWTKKVPVAKDVDVLVVGGGAAGVGAAICAARSGADTLLIEQEWALGGLVTLGLVDYVAGYPDGTGQELFDRLEAEGAVERRICDPEKCKRVMEEMVYDAGAEILYGTRVVDSIVEDDTIQGVLVHNKAGTQAILAHTVVDCSGDADVAAYAGVPFETGWDEADGYNQAVSLDFKLGNVNLPRFRDAIESTHSFMQTVAHRAVEEGVLSHLVETGYVGQFPGRDPEHGEIYVCTAHRRHCRTTDPDDLTATAFEQRQQIKEMVEFYRRYVPGFEDCWLIESAPLLGVRDSRRIVGEYVLTGEDVACARKFPDAIARDTHGFDIHNPTDLPHIKHVHLDEPCENAFCVPNEETGGYDAYVKPGQYYEIPYRSLVPLEVENLLVAGRCLSATFEAQSGARLILTCMTMGQAAGTAAAMSVAEETTPRELDPDDLRARLVEQGIRLDEEPPVYVRGGPHDPIPDDAEFTIDKSTITSDEIRIVDD